MRRIDASSTQISLTAQELAKALSDAGYDLPNGEPSMEIDDDAAPTTLELMWASNAPVTMIQLRKAVAT